MQCFQTVLFWFVCFGVLVFLQLLMWVLLERAWKRVIITGGMNQITNVIRCAPTAWKKEEEGEERRDSNKETGEEPCLNVLGGHLALRSPAMFVPWTPGLSSFITTGARLRCITCALTSSSRNSTAGVTCGEEKTLPAMRNPHTALYLQVQSPLLHPLLKGSVVKNSHWHDKLHKSNVSSRG